MEQVKRLERTLKEANTFLRHFDLTLLENLPYPELRSLLFSATKASEGLEKIKKGGETDAREIRAFGAKVSGLCDGERSS